MNDRKATRYYREFEERLLKKIPELAGKIDWATVEFFYQYKVTLAEAVARYISRHEKPKEK